MFKQLGVLTTFFAFAVALAVSGNIPSEVTSLPQQSLAIAQESKNQARLKLQRSLQRTILRQSGPAFTEDSPRPKHL